MCTRSLAGNSSLWSVTANVMSLPATAVEADATKQEWDIKVYNFL